MIIGTYSLPQPSRISKGISVIEAVNETLNYVTSHKPFGVNSYVSSVRFTWDAVTEEELIEMRQAFAHITLNYAYISTQFLGGVVQSYANSIMGTMSPQSTPKIQLNQESTSFTAYAQRTYTVEIDVVSYPGGMTL